mmetsp:Transcript_30283/g.67139  ORF Transcript_30283/g.67139 Transcript_30283/m.67139 type:complete len:266 (-) Transcript_30283:800-1597(-)
MAMKCQLHHALCCTSLHVAVSTGSMHAEGGTGSTHMCAVAGIQALYPTRATHHVSLVVGLCMREDWDRTRSSGEAAGAGCWLPLLPAAAAAALTGALNEPPPSDGVREGRDGRPLSSTSVLPARKRCAACAAVGESAAPVAEGRVLSGLSLVGRLASGGVTPVLPVPPAVPPVLPVVPFVLTFLLLEADSPGKAGSGVYSPLPLMLPPAAGSAGMPGREGREPPLGLLLSFGSIEPVGPAPVGEEDSPPEDTLPERGREGALGSP